MGTRDSYLKRPCLGWCVVYGLHSIPSSIRIRPQAVTNGEGASSIRISYSDLEGFEGSFYHLWRIGVQCGCTHGPTLHLMGGA